MGCAATVKRVLLHKPTVTHPVNRHVLLCYALISLNLAIDPSSRILQLQLSSGEFHPAEKVLNLDRIIECQRLNFFN